LDLFILDFHFWIFFDFVFFEKVEKYMRFAMVLQNGLLGKKCVFLSFCPFLTKPKIFKTDSIPLVFKGFLIAYDGLSTNKNVDNFILDFDDEVGMT